MSKTILIIILLVITVVACYVYFSNKLPPGVEPKGSEVTVAWISLLTGIVSLLGTVLTLVLKIIEIKANKQKRE